MFSELVKAIGSMSDLNHQPSIEKVSYQLSASVANTFERTLSIRMHRLDNHLLATHIKLLLSFQMKVVSPIVQFLSKRPCIV